MKSILFSILLFALSTVGFAKQKPLFQFHYQPMLEKPNADASIFVTQQQHQDLIGKVGKLNLRNLASTLSDDTRMSKEFKAIRDQWNSIGYSSDGKVVAADKMYLEAEKLDALLVKVEKEYKNYPDDAKLFSSLVLPMRKLKSIVWRSADVIEPSRALRQSLIDSIRTYYNSMRLFFPNQTWEVGFTYVTEPIAGAGSKFTNEAEIQKFLAGEFYPEVLKSIETVKSISISQENPLVWDNQLVMGKFSFPSGIDRFIAVREPERLAILSSLHKQAYWICLGSIYNVENTAQLASEVSALYGVELQKASIAPMFFSPTAPTRKDRVDLVRNNFFKTSFEKNKYGDAFALNAYEHLKSSVYFAHASWVILKDAPNYENAFMDPSLFKGDISKTEKSFANLLGLVSDKPYTVQSMVSEKVTVVDLKGFFTNLPQDAKTLLPTQFEDGKTEFIKRNINGQNVKFRNYRKGKVMGYNPQIYSALFPQLKADSAPSAVVEDARILNESRGSWAVSDVFDFFWR